MPHRYLLDANCLTQAFHLHYCFDICPGFWQWLDLQNDNGIVYSIDRIRSEVTRFENELSQWALSRIDGEFFLASTTDDVVAAYESVVRWVEASHFKRQGKDDFMSGSDGWLIAYAVAHDFTVVTNELFVPEETRKIKIPALCKAFGFRSIMIPDVLRETNAQLVLKSDF